MTFATPHDNHGAFETNPKPAGLTYPGDARVCWKTPGLYVTRLRLLSDPGFPAWDVSYCWGELDGRPVQVILPFSQLPKRGVTRRIISWAKHDGVYAKALGILDNISCCC